MNIKNFLLVLFLAILSGCAHLLHLDRVPPTISSGYDSVEIDACGEFFYGTGICQIPAHTPIRSLKIQVKGYWKGKVVVDGCGISESREYQNSEKVPIGFSGEVDKDCVLSITVSPVFPNQNKSPIITNSLRGHLYLLAKEPGELDEYRFDQVSLAGGVYPKWPLFIGGETLGQVQMVGAGAQCETDVNHALFSTIGFIYLPLDRVFEGTEVSTCVFRGTLDTPSDQANLLWIVNYYHRDFIPLADPSIRWDSDTRLCVQADSNVSIIDVGDKSSVSSSDCFRVEEGTHPTIRTSTVGGRTNVGIWNTHDNAYRWYK